MEDNTQQTEVVAAPQAPLTEVTTIAQEEEKTGQKIDVPSPEELVARASSSVISNLQTLRALIRSKNGGSYKISRKGMNRVVEAIFDLPTEGQRVMLQGKEEHHAFYIGQNLIRSLFILMQNHVNEELRKRKEAELAKQEEPKTEETKPSEGETNEPSKQ